MCVVLAKSKPSFKRIFVVRTWINIVFILCCLLWSPAIAEEKLLDWNKLFERDVVTERIRTTDNILGVKACFCVKSTPEHIWSVLTDYSYFPQIYKGLKKVNVRMKSDVGAEIEYVYLVHFLGIFNKELDYVINDQYSPSHRRIVWAGVSGDLERIEGSWEILDTQKEGTYLLEYSSYVKPPWYVPEFLVQTKAMNAVKEMAQAVRTWIEKGGQ
jgi:hypothetical protein